MTTAASRQDVIARITRRLEERLGPQRFKMWFDRSARFDYRDHDRRLDVAVPNRYVADWIGRHFQHDLQHAAVGEVGDPVSLSVHVDPTWFEDRPTTGRRGAEAASGPAAIRQGASTSATAQIGQRRAAARPTTVVPSATVATYRHRLQDFIVGACNELAYAAACRIAEDGPLTAAGRGRDAGGHPLGHAPGALFIHGGCGLGKTHLLQGVCRRVAEARPDARILYTTGEQFTNEFVAAVRTNKIDAFRRRIRKLDLLAVDDVHFIANKSATQQEFLHSFDALELGGARVVLASDNHPKLINAFSEALVSRCVRGMVVEVHRPDLATRIRIIEAIAHRRGLTVVEAVTRVLAERCHGSVRDIEGAITKLHALSHLMHSRPAGGGGEADPNIIGRALVDRLFEAQPVAAPRRIVRLDTIVQETCAQLGVTPAQVMGPTRSRPVVLARSIVIHLARQLTPMSYPEIAAAMGRSNHSTVITAAQRLARQLEKDQDLVLPGRMEQTRPSELLQRIREAIARA